MKTACVLVLAVMLTACAGPHQTLENTRSSTRAPVALQGGTSPPEQSTRALANARQAFDVIGITATVEERARVIQEVDGWLFTSAEQEAAGELLLEQVELLRVQIERQLGLLEKAALAAPDGRQAKRSIAEMGRVLQLYPMPETDEQQSRLVTMLSVMETTSRRTDEIRHLRYNAWAVDQIALGLTRFRELRSVWMDEAKKAALMESCLESTKFIHPSYLEPATLDLYRLLLEKTRSAITEPLQVHLTKELANPNTTRKTPADF